MTHDRRNWTALSGGHTMSLQSAPRGPDCTINRERDLIYFGASVTHALLICDRDCDAVRSSKRRDAGHVSEVAVVFGRREAGILPGCETTGEVCHVTEAQRLQGEPCERCARSGSAVDNHAAGGVELGLVTGARGIGREWIPQ